MAESRLSLQLRLAVDHPAACDIVDLATACTKYYIITGGFIALRAVKEVPHGSGASLDMRQLFMVLL